MLEFFRRYQKYIFVVITFVIVISFSFFGTYGVVLQNEAPDKTVFNAIDGTAIKQSELADMVVFIGTDSEDKLIHGGIWGPNFLNDGVISKDFLQTGLAEILVQPYSRYLSPDLQKKLEKEKNYTLYAHPEAKFINVTNAWDYFSPGIKTHYDALKQSTDSMDNKAFHERVQLYLQEKQFPAPLLRYVLASQQRQFNWVQPDPNLDRIDFSLFGYHTASDWFGPRFIELISQFIINAAKIAEDRGYSVSKQEALADLMRNAELSYEANRNRENVGVTSVNEYFIEQLRRMRMDSNKAASIWQKVLLFRRLFHDLGHSMFTDSQLFEKMNIQAKEYVDIDLYQMPKEFHFSDYHSLQKFTLYLNAVAKNFALTDLVLPKQFKTSEELAKSHPELVQKNYFVALSHVNSKLIATKIPLKQMWGWEYEENNWPKILKEFPELGLRNATSREERVSALENLDFSTRNRLDAYARQKIIEENPQLIGEALENTGKVDTYLEIRLRGKNPQIAGLDTEEKIGQFIRLLDQALLEGDSLQAKEKLGLYTIDKDNYYRIQLLDKTPRWEIISFAKASADGTLDTLLEKELEIYYSKEQQTNPKQYQNEEGAFKSFSEVQNKIAEMYFKKLLSSIREAYAKETGLKPPPSNGNFEASIRFLTVLKDYQKKIQENPSIQSSLIQSEEQKNAFIDQWKLQRNEKRIFKSSANDLVKSEEAFSTEAWSKVLPGENGQSFFFYRKNKGREDEYKDVRDLTNSAYALLSVEVQQKLMSEVLERIQEKNAIRLAAIGPEETDDNVEIQQ